ALLESRDGRGDRVHALVEGNDVLHRKVVEQVAVTVRGRVHHDRLARDFRGHGQRKGIVEAELLLQEIRIGRVKDIKRVRQVHDALQRAVLVGEFVREGVADVARYVQVCDVFQQVVDEEKDVDLVLVLGGLGVRSEVEVFAGRLLQRRQILGEVPRAARRLQKGRLDRQGVVDVRVRAGQLPGRA